jgi:hypothetical protein
VSSGLPEQTPRKLLKERGWGNEKILIFRSPIPSLSIYKFAKGFAQWPKLINYTLTFL